MGIRETWALESSDLELVRQAAKGDHAAFHALVDRHAKSLFRVAVRLAVTRTDAEDLVQETFAGAYKSLGKFDGRASVRTWLTRILMRRAADAWRASRRTRLSISLDGANGDSAELHPAVGSANAAVDQKLDLAVVLDQLAPEHREVLVLREMQGMSYAQIAQTLSVPQGTVESRLHRARAEVRRKLPSYLP